MKDLMFRGKASQKEALEKIKCYFQTSQALALRERGLGRGGEEGEGEILTDEDRDTEIEERAGCRRQRDGGEGEVWVLERTVQLFY